MTLDLTATYPGQVVTTDPAYPLGKARNRTSPTDGTGTPYEADLVNDLHGTLQAILDEGGITASGNADEVGTSDVVDAINAIATTIADARAAVAIAPVESDVTAAQSDITDLQVIGDQATYIISGDNIASGSEFTLTEATADSGFAVTSNEVEVPAAGRYLVTVQGLFTSDDASDPYVGGLQLSVGSSTHSYARAVLATIAQPVSLPITYYANITTPASQKVSLKAHNVQMDADGTFPPRLQIVRFR